MPKPVIIPFPSKATVQPSIPAKPVSHGRRLRFGRSDLFCLIAFILTAYNVFQLRHW
jgi:hypothetical protein